MNTRITNAKDRSIAEPAFLNMASALLGLFRPIKYFLVTQTVENFLAVETLTPFIYQGVLQPMKPRIVMMKPEGQRSWRWFTIHAEIGMLLKRDSIVWIKDVQYRVREEWLWEDYGYREYHLTQDFQDRKTSPPVPDVSLEKWKSTVVIAGADVSVNVSANITDARKALWTVYDSAKKVVLGGYTVLNSTTVQVNASIGDGTYTLIGEA